MNYQLQYPQALWLLVLLPVFIVVFLAFRFWHKRTEKKMGDPELVKALHPSYAPFKTVARFVLLMLAFVMGCIALANPRQPEASTEVRKGIDIVIALDVSNSMLAKDISPDRLSRAKQFIAKFIDGLEEDRTSLVLFAGYGYIRTPLTFDKGATRMFVSVADPSTISQQGTNISDALNKSLFVFGDQDERFRTVILITDGETHSDGAIETATDLASRGIMVNTIGIGSQKGATLLDSAGNVKTDQGQVVVSKLNEQVLKDIASVTNGFYLRLESSDDAVEKINSQFAEIDKKALGDMSTFTFRPFYAWLAIPMLLILITELFFPDRKKIKNT